MRDELKELINNTILYKYDLPNPEKGIKKSILSTQNDKCYSSTNDNALAEVIYNSIIDYSFNEFDIPGKDYEVLLFKALQSKLNYNDEDSDINKRKYGFFGETLLYCILYVMFNAKPIISRGYFYNPLEKSETKGYDAYHLIENEGMTELWFGEVKFHQAYTSCIRSAIDNLDKVISDKYLNDNFLAMVNHKNNFNIRGSKVADIINDWEMSGYCIDILEEVKKHDVKLIYPMFFLYDKHRDGYTESIKSSITYIEKKYSKKSFNLSIPYSIYFIWLPVDKVSFIKKTVIEWISSKKQLIS